MRILLLTSIVLIVVLITSCDEITGPGDPPNISHSFYSVENTTQIFDTPELEFHPRWSNDGTKVAFARFNEQTSELGLWIWEKNTGNVRPIRTGLRGDVSPTWSPDDTQIAYDARDNNDVSQIFIANLNDGSTTKFRNTTNAFRPCWSKDGTKIAYIYRNAIYVKELSGGSAVKIDDTDGAWNPEWNIDDSRLLFNAGGNGISLFTINIDGSDLQNILSTSSTGEIWAKWSPDNSFILYDKDSDSNTDLFVREVSTGSEQALTNSNDCRFLDWSSDGNHIVFVRGDDLWEMRIAALE